MNPDTNRFEKLVEEPSEEEAEEVKEEEEGEPVSEEILLAPEIIFEPQAAEDTLFPNLDLEVAPPKVYGPVRDSETLWSIAYGLRTDLNIGVEQIMLAILKLNPQAFPTGNVFNLNTGAFLKLPTDAQIDAVTRKEAERIAAEHELRWQAAKPWP